MPEQSGMPGDDSLRDRPPTTHEREAGESWDASYIGEPAPWDTGRPQPAVVRLAAEGRFTGPVLDAGCGSGENALFIAAQGVPVFGFDVAETAVEMARTKAAEQGVDAEFAVADALRLERLGRTFATVLDCGLFHAFDDEERQRYVASLASVCERDATAYILCFSDEGGDTGAHPVTKADLRAAFTEGNGWHIAAIESDRLQTRVHGPDGAPAWLATVTRT